MHVQPSTAAAGATLGNLRQQLHVLQEPKGTAFAVLRFLNSNGLNVYRSVLAVRRTPKPCRTCSSRSVWLETHRHFLNVLFAAVVEVLGRSSSSPCLITQLCENARWSLLSKETTQQS